LDHGEEVSGTLVVSGGDPLEMLDLDGSINALWRGPRAPNKAIG